MRLNSLANDTFLDQSNLKGFADNEINVIQKLKLFWERAKRLWEKEKMLVTSIFSQSFQKNSFSRSLKVGIVWERVTCF